MVRLTACRSSQQPFAIADCLTAGSTTNTVLKCHKRHSSDHQALMCLPGAAVGSVTMTRTNHTLVCVPDIFEEQRGERLPVSSLATCLAPANIQSACSPVVSTSLPICYIHVILMCCGHMIPTGQACMPIFKQHPLSHHCDYVPDRRLLSLSLQTLPCQRVVLQCHISIAAAATRSSIHQGFHARTQATQLFV